MESQPMAGVGGRQKIEAVQANEEIGRGETIV
jgi:hypothetical protein